MLFNDGARKSEQATALVLAAFGVCLNLMSCQDQPRD
jgi:hypothetical protein